MQSDKIKKFMSLAGQTAFEKLRTASEAERKLGAQLLLSETLEYVIKGLGVIPVVDGKEIREADGLEYVAANDPDPIEMIDGLADVAYTMYWNACAFGIPLEKAFEMVCDNNLEKFVKLENGRYDAGALPRDQWSCDQNVQWPKEVDTVSVLRIGSESYAVGKDARGKVRKPSNYKSVDLTVLL